LSPASPETHSATTTRQKTSADLCSAHNRRRSNAPCTSLSRWSCCHILQRNTCSPRRPLPASEPRELRSVRVDAEAKRLHNLHRSPPSPRWVRCPGATNARGSTSSSTNSGVFDAMNQDRRALGDSEGMF
jgi:hypothetical protein